MLTLEIFWSKFFDNRATRTFWVCILKFGILKKNIKNKKKTLNKFANVTNRKIGKKVNRTKMTFFCLFSSFSLSVFQSLKLNRKLILSLLHFSLIWLSMLIATNNYSDKKYTNGRCWEICNLINTFNEKYLICRLGLKIISKRINWVWNSHLGLSFEINLIPFTNWSHFLPSHYAAPTLSTLTIIFNLSKKCI